jgi:hypothetical protein
MTETTIDKGALEAAAQAIYEHWKFGADDLPRTVPKPAWVPNGNSHKQEEARGYARAALAALPVSREAVGVKLRELSERCRRLAYPSHPPIFIEIADEIDALLLSAIASHTVDTREAVAWRWRIDAQAEWNVTDNKAIADYAVIQGNEVEPLGRVSEPDDGFVARDFIDTASQLRSGHNVIRQAAVNDHLDVILAALDRQTGVL